MLQRGIVEPPRQALRDPARRGLPRLPAERGHLRAAPDPPAGRDLDADRERQDASTTWRRMGLKAMVTLNGEKVLDQVVRAYRDACVPARAAQGARRGPLLGRGSLPGRLARGGDPPRSSPPTTSATSGSRRSASCATPTSRGGRGARRARPPACRRCARASSRRRGCAGRRAEVIETIREIEARYPGLDQCMIHWAEGMPPAEFKEQLRWFARDVMPAFAGRR